MYFTPKIRAIATGLLKATWLDFKYKTLPTKQPEQDSVSKRIWKKIR